MPILSDKETVQFQPATGLVRQYAPQIPEMDLRGMRQYGQALEQVGDDLMSHSAKAIATEEAQRIPIGKDADGNYVRPPAMPGWGAKATEVYDGIVNEKFKQTVYRDAESKLRDIAATNQFDPDKAEREMKAHIGGVLKGTDGRFVGELTPLLERDASQHLYTIKTDFFRRGRLADVQFFKEDRERDLARAQDAGSAGDTVEEDRHLANASKKTGILVALGAESELGAEAEKARHDSNRAANKVLAIYRQRTEDGNLHPDQVTDGMRILSGLAGLHENTIGITQATLDAIPDREARNALVSNLGKLHTLAQASWARRRETIELEQLGNHFAVGGRGKPEGLAQDKFDDWLAQQALKAGKNLATPEGVDWAWQQYGDVSKKALDTVFRNMPSAGVQELTNALPMFQKLSTLQDSDGTPAKQLGHVSPDNIRMMENWKHAIASNPSDPATAVKTARQGYEAGLNVKPASEEVARFVRERWMQKEGTAWNTKDRISAELKHASFSDLTQKNIDAIELSIGQIAAGDVPIKDAVALAVRQFEARNAKSAFDAKVGLRPLEETLPAVADPRNPGKQTTDWIKPYVAKLFTEKGPDGKPLVEPKAGGMEIKNPELGVNLALEPSGYVDKERTFRVIFKPNGMGDATMSIPLVDAHNQPILFRTDRAQQIQNDAARVKIPERERAVREAYGKAGPEGYLPEVLGEPATVPKIVDSPVRGPVELKDVLVHAAIPPFGRGTFDKTKAKVPRYGLDARMDDVPPLFGPKPPPFITAPDGSVTTPSGDPAKVREDAGTFYELRSFLRDGKPARTIGELDVGFGRQLAAMIREMPQEIRQGFTLSSGHRTGEEQAAIHASSPPGMAAKQGHSKHEVGHAFDLRMTSEAEAWAHRNAARFGLQFPLMGQRPGIPYEPWHIEPIWARGKRADLGPDSPFSDDYS